jgi:YegS/Rv2252/BmrU family lipid kinase
MGKAVTLIGNPAAGGGVQREIHKAVSILDKSGYDVRLLLTEKRADAASFAKTITEEFKKPGSTAGVDDARPLVIAAGGDGTCNEVANGLACSGIPMAILPLGTTSVLAREIGVPASVEKALDIALKKKVQTVHLGKITFTTSNGQETRYFILMAGIGFDGEAVFGVSETLKKRLGKGAYVLNGLKALLRYNPAPLTITAKIVLAGRPAETIINSYAAIVGNASRYGGDFTATPDARLTEPCFHVLATHGNRRRDLLRYALGVVFNRHLAFKDITCFSADELLVKGNAHIQIDGDYAGMTPARLTIERDALELVVP